MKFFVIAFALLLALPAGTFAQEGRPASDQVGGITLSGFLRDKKTHEPVAGATIDVLSALKQTLRKQTTKVSGEFRIKKEQAEYIQISALGYHDTLLKIPEGNNIIVYLEQKPLLGEDITVTAQKHTTFTQDVPISISIVKTKEITERSPESIDYSLRYIPGVTVTQSQVSIRGSSGFANSVGSRVLFLLDGMPYLSADNGDIKFDALPIMNIDRIEVVKGAGSALYGSSALGGVINVITRKPSDSLHGAINANIGEYDQVKYPEWQIPGLGRKFASLEGGLTATVGETGLLGSFAVRRNEGYRLGDDSYKSSGFAKVTNSLSDHDHLETMLLLANENHGGFLFWKDLDHPLMPSDSLGAVNGRIHSFKAHLQTSLQSILSDHFILTSRANIHYTNFSTDPSQAGQPPGAHSNATSYDIEFEGNSDFLKSVYLTTGVSSIYETVNSDLYQSHHGLTISGFAQAEYRLEPLIFTLGLRGDATKYDDSVSLGNISPKFGVTLDAGNGLNFRASLGTGFRAPTIAEKYIDQVFNGIIHVIPNTALTPEKSYSAEVGGSYRTKNVYLDGAMFYSSFDNLIEPHFVTSNGTPVIQFGNLTKAEIFGHEEVIEFYPLSNDDLSLRLGYTYVFPQDRVTKQILNFRPRHLLQARAETKFGAITLSTDFRYISKYESVDSTLITEVTNGDARVDAYIWDARITYTTQGLFGLPVTFSFQAQNLLNYYYVEIVGNLAPIRNFTLRVETVF